MSDFKLTIEIRKPSYAQEKTVRNSIPPSLWKTVRTYVQEVNGYKCQICDTYAGESLHAHEVWDYDEEKFLLILKEVQALCRSCHDLKHIHHAALRSKNGTKKNRVMQKLRKHFMRVNKCTEDDFSTHYRNQLAKNDPRPVKRSLEDLIELRELREREEFLRGQEWKFVLEESIPYKQEIASVLNKKGLLYKEEKEG